VRAAGTSTAVFDDSVHKDIQPDIYFPLVEKPAAEADSRIEALKQIRHGLVSLKGETTEKALKAGMRSGVDEYLESFKERVYRSVKMEPLGKPFVRAFDIPEGVVAGGLTRSVSLSAKESLFPRHPVRDSEADHERYVVTHASYAPGEQIGRNYAWPAEVASNSSFAFGQPNERSKGGAKDALTWERYDEQSKIALKRLEDFRQVTRDHLGKSKSTMRDVPHDLRFGVKSTSSSNTAAQCLSFNVKAVEELMPDADLGRAKRRVGDKIPPTSSSRVFGVPSIRTDIQKPASRSLADIQNYGDDPGAAVLLNPQRFENMGVYDEDFTTKKTKSEIRSLVPSLSDEEFDETWRTIGADATTVQHFLHTYGREVVAQRIKNLADLRH
jgi:hypothetical protein